MERISEFITGFWKKYVNVSGVQKPKFEVRVTADTLKRLQSLKEGDLLQMWVNEQRKGHNSPTHMLRRVPGGNFQRNASGQDESCDMHE